MVRYSQHARDQMADRRISEEEVEETVAAPSVSSPGKPHVLGPTLVLWRTVNGRRIKVVVPADDTNFVVTVASPDE